MLRDPALIPLSHQHHNGLALTVLTRRSLAADTSPANLRKLADRIVARYEIELVNHFDLEERVLFPAAGAYLSGAQNVSGPIAGLIAEHRELERLVERLRAEASPELLERFCALLSTHIRKEENELFQRIQAALPAEDLAAVGREIEAGVVRVCL